ncbi:hypothetical protein B484DRAFT_459071 [Ochromonadaceae sp. CCMP2298]|nr:hypothetical protein B484DRAFT_459071 [Ochromonadaceae sp. CCMP2298]
MEEPMEQAEPTKQQIEAARQLRVVMAAEVCMAGLYPDEYFPKEAFVVGSSLSAQTRGHEEFEDFSPPESLSMDQVCEMYFVSKTSQQRVVKLLEAGVAVQFKAGGRPPTLSPQAIEELKEDISREEMTRGSSYKTDLREKFVGKRKEEAEKLGQNALAIKDVCDKTAMKYINLAAPESCNKPSTQCERRFDALQRPVKHVSVAALWRALAKVGYRYST